MCCDLRFKEEDKLIDSGLLDGNRDRLSPSRSMPGLLLFGMIIVLAAWMRGKLSLKWLGGG